MVPNHRMSYDLQYLALADGTEPKPTNCNEEVPFYFHFSV
jgi:hypothetical protein